MLILRIKISKNMKDKLTKVLQQHQDVWRSSQHWISCLLGLVHLLVCMHHTSPANRKTYSNIITEITKTTKLVIMAWKKKNKTYKDVVASPKWILENCLRTTQSIREKKKKKKKRRQNHSTLVKIPK